LATAASATAGFAAAAFGATAFGAAVFGAAAGEAGAVPPFDAAAGLPAPLRGAYFSPLAMLVF